MVEQAKRREVVLAVIDDDEWTKTVRAWLVMAQTTPSVIYPLLPYLMGAAKQEINVTGQIEHVQMQTARTVLRVVGGTEKRAS